MKIPFFARLLFVSVLCAIAAYMGTYLLKPRYRSSETLYFPLAKSGGASSSPLSSLRGPSGDTSDVGLLNGAFRSPLVGSSPEIAIGFIKSRGSLKRVVERHNLARAYGVKSDAQAVKMLAGRLKADVDKAGFLIVEVEDEDRVRAARILHSVRQYLEEASTRFSINVSRKNREFVQRELRRADEDLRRKRVVLGETLRRSPLADTEAVSEHLGKIRDKLEEARMETASAEAKLRESERFTRRLLAQAGSAEGKIAAVKAFYGESLQLAEDLKARALALEDAAAEYTAESPEFGRIKRAHQNVNKVAADLLKIESSNLQQGFNAGLYQARAELLALKGTVQRYTNLEREAQRQFEQSPTHFVQVATARQDFEAAQKRYEILNDELQKARVAEQRDPARFEVVDVAEPSDETTYPRRVVIAGLVFALVFGLQLVPRLLRPETTYGLPVYSGDVEGPGGGNGWTHGSEREGERRHPVPPGPRPEQRG